MRFVNSPGVGLALEVHQLGPQEYLCRPKGRSGLGGKYPFKWRAVLGRTEDEAKEFFKRFHEEYL